MLQVPSKVDLPVGKRYLDHTGVTLVALLNESVGFIPKRDLKITAVSEYVLYGQGEWNSSCV